MKIPKKKITKNPVLPNKIGPKNIPEKRHPIGYLILIAFFGAAIAFFAQTQMGFPTQKIEKIALSELLVKYKKNELLDIQIKDQEILAKSKTGNVVFTAYKEPNATIKDLGFSPTENPTKIEVIDTSVNKMWMNFLVGLAPFLLLILIIYYFSKKAGGMGGDGGPFGFGKSRAKIYDKTKHQTKFESVAGAEEAKEDVAEVVDFLKTPKKYQKAGAKIPTGILLVGPPGTGKTLIARAIAGEANVPFFSVSGSEFVEMFVGVGASRVRDLFKTAKRNAPSIIFIDEIDAIGKQRGTGGGSGGHDEREQTLNQILTEMDGFEPETSVIVVAATNRPDVLDKALLRPGRFDRRIHVDLPDMEAREKILKLHAQNKKLEKGIALRKIATKTVGFSGADLENIMNEAAIASVKAHQKVIMQKNLDDAVEKVSLGPSRKFRRITEIERKIIAVHEVGHAISGHFTENCEPVHKISIISRGSALGVTWFLPEEDRYLQSEQKMKDEMVSLHGGRIAERLIFKQTTSGASNDLERITRIARAMVMTYGMGDSKTIGPVVFQRKNRGFSGVFLEKEEGEHSEKMAELIDEEVKKLVLEAESRCTEILKAHLALLQRIAEDLLVKENISREEFLSYFEKPKKQKDPEVK